MSKFVLFEVLFRSFTSVCTLFMFCIFTTLLNLLCGCQGRNKALYEPPVNSEVCTESCQVDISIPECDRKVAF